MHPDLAPLLDQHCISWESFSKKGRIWTEDRKEVRDALTRTL